MNRITFLRTATAAIALATLGSASAFAETVSLYTYHNHPPFINEAGKGLSYDLVELLNKKAKGTTFKIDVVSRAQLDKIISTPDFQGAVVWVNPVWFKDKDKTTYLWSNPLMDDANVVLSNASKKVDYKDPSSLKGKQFGGIVGHNYAGIDDLVASGAIKREDADKERSNLRKLEGGRIDATLLPRSTANYLLHDMALTEAIHVAPTPQSTYTRHVLVSKKTPEIQKLVNDTLAEIAKDGSWKETLARYKSK